MNITRTTVHSSDYSKYSSVLADFEVLADPNPSSPLVALLARPVNAEPFLLPLDVRAARDLGLMLFDSVLAAAPALALEMLGGSRP